MASSDNWNSEDEIEEELFRAALRSSLIYESEEENKNKSSENSDTETSSVQIQTDDNDVPLDLTTKPEAGPRPTIAFKRDRILHKDKMSISSQARPYLKKYTLKDLKKLATMDDRPKKKPSNQANISIIKFLFDDGTFNVVECVKSAVYDDLILYLKNNSLRNLDWSLFVCDLRCLNPKTNLGKLPKNMEIGALDLPEVVEIRVILHYW